jgi:hypothetical protein
MRGLVTQIMVGGLAGFCRFRTLVVQNDTPMYRSKGDGAT